MARTIPSSDIVFVLDSKSGFNNPSNLPVTFNDVDWTDEGFVFNGTSSYIDVGNDHRTNNITNEITLEGLVYPRRASPYEYILSNTRDCCGDYNGYELLIYNGGAGIRFWDPTTYKTRGVSGLTTVSLNTWHHIVGTFDGSLISIYLDGKIDGTYSWSGTIGTPASFNLYVGAMGYSPSSYNIDGIISRVCIYNRALTSQEVADLYNKYTYGGYL